VVVSRAGFKNVSFNQVTVFHHVLIPGVKAIEHFAVAVIPLA
jgi:hypothetical protein